MGTLYEFEAKERERQVNLLFGDIIDLLKDIEPTMPQQVIKHLQEMATPASDNALAPLYIFVLTAWFIIGDDEPNKRKDHDISVRNQLRKLQRNNIKEALLSTVEQIKNSSHFIP